jgi:hypothetical protein
VTSPAPPAPATPPPFEIASLAATWLSRAGADPDIGRLLGRHLPRFALRRFTDIVAAAYRDDAPTPLDYHLFDPFRHIPGLGEVLVSLLEAVDAHPLVALHAAALAAPAEPPA